MNFSSINFEWGQVGIKLGRRHAIFQELVTSMYIEKKISMLTVLKVSSLAWHVYFTSHNMKCKGEPHRIELKNLIRKMWSVV